MLRINWWARKVASLPAELLPFASVDSFGFFSVPSPKELLAASVVICQCFLAGCLRDESFFAKDAVNFTNNWKHKHFTDVFVDEVSQAMEFEVLVPLLSVSLFSIPPRLQRSVSNEFYLPVPRKSFASFLYHTSS